MCTETANDTALYLTIEGENDSATLQHDLDKSSTWERDLDMELNPSKCQVIRVTGSRKPINTTYRLHSLNCKKNLVPHFSREIQQISVFVLLFLGFSD